MEKKNTKNTKSTKKTTTKRNNTKKTITKKETKKKTRKGFTLIELLAVIIILGVLMIIAIPAVTSYINNSRKSSYISSAKNIISGARTLVNQGRLEMYDTNTTYYIPVSFIKSENGTRSPYGDFTQAYIGVIYTGKGYNYFWISNDTAHQGIKTVTAMDKLDNELIESDLNDLDIRQTVETTGILGREKILILGENGSWEEARSAIQITDGAGGIQGITAKFKLNDTYFDFDPGMTWLDWINSEYNTIYAMHQEDLDLIYTTYDGYACNYLSSIYNYYVIANNNTPVKSSDVINRNYNYVNEWDSCFYSNTSGTYSSCMYGINSAC